MTATEYRTVLKKTGWILIAIGVTDIILLTAAILSQQAYSSSLVLAAIAGVFLIRGSLNAASWVLWFAIFFLTAVVALLVASPFLQPVGLTWAQFQSDPSAAILNTISTLITVVLIVWVIRQLSSEPVKVALLADGKKPVIVSRPVLLGILLVMVLLGITIWMQFTE